MPKPKKRTALEVLKKKRLAQLVHEFELDAATSQPKAALIDAILLTGELRVTPDP